jgi:hypothetical protein
MSVRMRSEKRATTSDDEHHMSVNQVAVCSHSTRNRSDRNAESSFDAESSESTGNYWPSGCKSTPGVT